MGDFEDKLNNILSNPAELEKIMGLASRLMGGSDTGTASVGMSASSSGGNSDNSRQRSRDEGAPTVPSLPSTINAASPQSGLSEEKTGSAQSAVTADAGAGLASALPTLMNSNMLRQLGGLMSNSMSSASAGDNKMALLNAMGPYLSRERREKLQKAMRFAKMAKLAREIFREYGGESSV